MVCCCGWLRLRTVQGTVPSWLLPDDLEQQCH